MPLSRATRFCWLIALGMLCPGASPAQGTLPFGEPVIGGSPIVTLDPERLFAKSQFGQRVTRQFDVASAELLAENRRIEAELGAEEADLTRRRPTLPGAEFRALADAFDARVGRARDEQDSKGRALQRRRDQERQAFLVRVPPILAEVMRGLGAVAILDGRSVFLSVDGIDITAQAVARVDAVLGDGAALELLPPGTPEIGAGDAPKGPGATSEEQTPPE